MVKKTKKTQITVFYSIIFICQALMTNAGVKKYYAIYFNQKTDSSYSITEPDKFLTQRAIERRQKQGININWYDLPVNTDYLNKLTNLSAPAIYTSKWLNAALVAVSESKAEEISTLSFVKKIELLCPITDKNINHKENFKTLHDTLPAITNGYQTNLTSTDYGATFTQNQMLGTDTMHLQGINGQGVLIAVLDAGFRQVNTHLSTKHLLENRKIRATYDFVDGEKNVYDDHQHGSYVVSCIGAYWPGKLIGTAYNANFLLFRTEQVSYEYPIELFYWVVAAEKADSLGADIITTSLGYNTFDNSEMDYSYSTLDGNTSFMTQAADIAASKGIVVISSAGNYGNSSWRYITIPSDGDSVLSVGAVHMDSTVAATSSRGPTADGRLKPEVVARGTGVAYLNPFDNEKTSAGSGTSYAAPLVAGLMGGLLQALPNTDVQYIANALKLSASNATNPNNDYGFGIPNYMRTIKAINNNLVTINQTDTFILKPSITNTTKNIQVETPIKLAGKKAEVHVFGMAGKKISKRTFPNLPPNFTISVAGLEKGVYILNVALEDGRMVSQKFAVQ